MASTELFVQGLEVCVALLGTYLKAGAGGQAMIATFLLTFSSVNGRFQIPFQLERLLTKNLFSA